jgi:hypothetical protein
MSEANSILDNAIGPIADKLSEDAFGRLRVSNPITLFDSKQILDNQPLFWSDAELSGGGTSSTYSATSASSLLAVSNLTAGRRVRQTKRYFNYQTGKSQSILMTGVLGSGATGITRRLGYYDDNNGIFFQLSGSTFSVGIRKNGVDTIVNQSEFNGDKLDGVGESELTFDPSKIQIFYTDFQWLGAGKVRMGLIINNGPVLCHTFYTANIGSSVYMSKSNLPIRYEIVNDGSGPAAGLVCVCSSVISEAGSTSVGTTFSVDRGLSGFVTGVGSTSLVPVLSMRFRSGYNFADVEPRSFTVLNATDNNFRWCLLLNPTLAGVDGASWLAVANSAVEYDISRTATNVVSGGTLLLSGYASDLTNIASENINSLLKLGVSLAGVRDEIVLAAQNLSAANETYYASITYNESI